MSNLAKHGGMPAKQTSLSVFHDTETFEHAQRISKMLASSDLLPKDYRGNIANTVIAYSMSLRMNCDPLMVMQNLNIVEGRPTWSASFIAAALRTCGRFKTIKFRFEDLGRTTVKYTVWEKKPQEDRATPVPKTEEINNKSCRLEAVDQDGELIVGPTITLEMAVKEGWYSRRGSKWQTMPEIMLQYRAASFFGRIHAADILMGMHSDEEVLDQRYAQEPETVDAQAVEVSSAPTAQTLEKLEQTAKARRAERKPKPAEAVDAEPFDASTQPTDELGL